MQFYRHSALACLWDPLLKPSSCSSMLVTKLSFKDRSFIRPRSRSCSLARFRLVIRHKILFHTKVSSPRFPAPMRKLFQIHRQHHRWSDTYRLEFDVHIRIASDSRFGGTRDPFPHLASKRLSTNEASYATNHHRCDPKRSCPAALPLVSVPAQTWR